MRYNPLAIESIAESLVRKIHESLCGPLPPSIPFSGAGVYMIYYKGPLEIYSLLSQVNQEDCIKPIYVGKAVPSGGRIGVAGNNETGQELYKRLVEHGDSIHAATNLEISDFACRYLAVEHLFIALAEHTLINTFKPIWNYHGGFGNHDPGKGRYNQRRSRWDTVHPGRNWAVHLKNNEHDAAYWANQFQVHIVQAEQDSLPAIPLDVDELSSDE